VYTGWVWGMGDMDSGGEQAFIVDLGSAKQKVINNFVLIILRYFMITLFIFRQ